MRDPDELVKEIELTRENLARTIDTLTQRVSPANVARNAVAHGKERLGRTDTKVAGGVALAAFVTVAYLVWRRRK